MTGPRVGYVCTNYNNASFTRAAIESLRAGPRWPDVRVVVVDNASADGDREALQALQAQFPEIDVVYNQVNAGYFPGLNLGIARLRASHPGIQLLVIGNNDLEFPAEFVSQVEQARTLLDEWAVVAPDLVTPEGVHQNPHVQYPISRLRRLVWALYFQSMAAASAIRLAAAATRRLTVRPENARGSRLYLSAGPIEQGYGACYLLGPKFFRHFDQLYAPTFLMQEEYFLYEQLRAINQLTYYSPSVVVRHRGHATMGLVPGRRQWEISRDAHHVYAAFRRLDGEARRALIMAATGMRP